jgi:eukaryotic-like serine/threonine-protein kinase
VDKLPIKGDLIASKYLVERTIGSGGMGAVFEVSHRVTGKRFAIKWLLPTLAAQTEAVGRFMREAQVAGRVDHPNIVEVYDFGQEGDSFYIVMELLQGEPLSRRLERVRQLPLDVACRILIPVARGLHAAHAAGVIHRDLKPDNIFLCDAPSDEEAPKVVDFGISKMSSLAGETGAHVTKMGVVLGTPRYMSPEQIRCEGVDARTDVYALGVILYEMLAGCVPFPGDNYGDIVLRIMTEPPMPLAQLAPGTPQAIVDVVDKALARERSQRFPDVQAFALALEPFSADTRFAVSAVRSQPPAELDDSAPPQRDTTPFSTESLQLNLGMHAERTRTKPRFIVGGVIIAALMVMALGAVAFVASKRNVQLATGQASGRHAAAAAAMPAPRPISPEPPASAPLRAATNNSAELPIPNTTRIAGSARTPVPVATAAARPAPTMPATPDAGVAASPGHPDTRREAAHAVEPVPVAPVVRTRKPRTDGVPAAALNTQPPEPSSPVLVPETPAPATPPSVQRRTVELGPSDF